jgi:hypothetical protein
MKLTHQAYENYLYLCRDGVLPRKRNLDAVQAREQRVAQEAEIATRVKRIRSSPSVFKPWPRCLEADAWAQLFKHDALRYPILVVHGPSFSGKTEWGKSLFACPLEVKIGTLQHFPDKLRSFDRKLHDGIIVDDVRDCQFIVQHQEKFQGKYDCLVEFASTPGGQCAYAKDLYAVPIVVTINNSTSNRELLQTDDFLGNESNRLIIKFPFA